MPSPSTSTLRSGTVSRLAGAGALEKSCRGACGACCWNGAKKSPPNQPPPLLRGGAGRCCGGGPPKLKNCADAGPATPINSASATASATSGPGSENTRKNDFGLCIRLGRNGREAACYTSGIGPQAGRFLAINRAGTAIVKGEAEICTSRLLL